MIVYRQSFFACMCGAGRLPFFGKGNEVDILLYNKVRQQSGRRLQNVLAQLEPFNRLELCESINGLSFRLRHAAQVPSIAVLNAGSHDELSALVALAELLRDVRIILILPDRKMETAATGHRLHPRYLAYADGDFADVLAVLRKMLAKIRHALRPNPKRSWDLPMFKRLQGKS